MTQTSTLRSASRSCALLAGTAITSLVPMAAQAHAADCAGSSFPSPASKDVSGTVTIVMEDVTDTEFVKRLVPAFNEVYPNVKIGIQGAAYDVIRDQQIASLQRSEDRKSTRLNSSH